MSQKTTIALTVVLERTDKGQSEVIRPTLGLSDSEKLLLSILTGFTPLQNLKSLRGVPAEATRVAETLLSLGLVREIPTPTLRVHPRPASQAQEPAAMA